jgi:hypothetical protein
MADISKMGDAIGGRQSDGDRYFRMAIMVTFGIGTNQPDSLRYGARAIKANSDLRAVTPHQLATLAISPHRHQKVCR